MRFSWGTGVLAAGCIFAATAMAQGKADPQAEMAAAFEAAKATLTKGPADVKLKNQATLHLPAKYIFVPNAEAVRILRAMGNRPNPDTLGVIFPADEGENWFMVANYVDAGYIKDDDAKDWKADDLLSNIKEGTDDANKERRTRGIPEIEVIGWVEKPTYDAASHRLVWSLSSRSKGASAADDPGVNYNTYLLGRQGFISMNLVTGLSEVEAQKPIARELLAAVEFDKGRTYGEFNSSTDKVAEYGLAALVAGVAAKKLGFFALIAAFAAKFAKIIGIAVLAFGAGIVKFFRGRNSDTPSV
jgi:uncharacterized membrane-anchored protein